MAPEPSFNELMLLVLSAGAFVMWVVSDVLEEQMLGRQRRARQKAAKRPTALPPARVHRGS